MPKHGAKDRSKWFDGLRSLHQIVEKHAKEEEDVEFPELRAALDATRTANLVGEVHCEKEMLL
jgi:hypothetical protein